MTTTTPETCSFCDQPAEYECGDSPACEDPDSSPSLMCEDHACHDPVSCVWRCPACAERLVEYDANEAVLRIQEGEDPTYVSSGMFNSDVLEALSK